MRSCSARAACWCCSSQAIARAAPLDQHRASRLPRRDGVATGAGRPHDLRVRSRSACSGPTPTATPTAATGAIGGGTYDAATNTYGQGAFNADDIARAAVVYVRHWRRDRLGRVPRARRTRCCAGLTYLQSPNGNVVLWMQPDGTLNPSAEPVELPDPSDSGPSYWLARTVWALGEGYRAFKRDDPAFARFLRRAAGPARSARSNARCCPSTAATQIVDGQRVPGVADRRRRRRHRRGDARPRRLRATPAGARPRVARWRGFGRGRGRGMRAGDAGGATWPYGAVLPWALSRSIWHAWGVADAGRAGGAPGTLGRELLAPASPTRPRSRRTCSSPRGPENGWNPTPTDGTQIAYGADSPLQSLLAVADRPGGRRCAGSPASRPPGTSATTRPGRRCTTPRPAGPSTASPATARSTATAARSRRSTACCRCSRSTPRPTSRPRPPVALPLARTTWRLLEAEAGDLTGGASS